jgi:putative DNA primase/helicase
LGDYATATKATLLLRASRNQDQDPERPQPFLVQLRGKRLASCAELPERTPINEAMLKDLSGGDTITARGLNKNPVEFRNTARVIVRANHPPLIADTNEAVWSRLLIVPFDVVIPEEKRDKDLAAKIVESETAGILNLALKGLASFAARGYRFNVPKNALDALKKHRAESDVLGTWLDEKYLVSKTDRRDRILQSNVTLNYMQWCKENNHHPHSSVALWRKLREHLGYDPIGKIDGDKYVFGFTEKSTALNRVSAASDGNVVSFDAAAKKRRK